MIQDKLYPTFTAQDEPEVPGEEETEKEVPEEEVPEEEETGSEV